MTELLVVGGGATGVGIARDAALRGMDATLVERDGLSAGTTGRSHGLLHSGARYADGDPTGAGECLAERETLAAIAGSAVRETGGLFVQLADDSAAYFERKREACASVGIQTEAIGPDAAREFAPDLSEAVVRALRVPDGVVFPSRLVAATAADAERAGATVHMHAPVENVTVRDGRVASVTVGGRLDRTFEPALFVNAAGPWAGHVAAALDCSVGMAPARGVMVAVDYDRPHPVVNRCREPDDGDIVVPHETQTVVGTTSVPVSDPDDYERADWEVERSIAECAAMLPPVADAAVCRTWWGVRPLYEPDETGTDRRGISRGFTVLDHATDGVTNAVSVVGGKLTTHRLMAEAAVDLVCEKRGVAADCVTADRRLPGADDPAAMDRLVARYNAHGPTDADVVADDPARPSES